MLRAQRARNDRPGGTLHPTEKRSHACAVEEEPEQSRDNGAKVDPRRGADIENPKASTPLPIHPNKHQNISEVTAEMSPALNVLLVFEHRPLLGLCIIMIEKVATFLRVTIS